MGLNKFSENEVIEFKKSTSELKEGVISIVSILNKHQNGKLYFGIKDDGAVLGQQISASTVRDVTRAIAENIEPKIYPSVNKVKIEDNDCILVEFEGDDIPYLAYGRAYIRMGDEDRQLSMKEMRNIILKNDDNNRKWETQISDYSIDNIDEGLLKEFIEKGIKAKRINYEYTNKIDILKKLGLINKNNKLLNAGYALFVKEAKIELQMAIFATDTKLTFLDIEQMFGNIFELIDIGEGYIRKNIKWPVNFNTGNTQRLEIPEIPMTAIREAVINSIIHRDFKNPKSNEIALYKNRVEIFNPGEFPEGYTPEDFIKGEEGSIPKNPLIANSLYLTKDIEKWGSGLKRIYEECKKEDVKVEFKIKKNGFTVIFYRKTDEQLYEMTQENAGLSKGLNKLKNEDISKNRMNIINALSIDNTLTIEQIAKKLNISKSTVRRDMQKLKDKNVLRRIGSDKKGIWEIDFKK